jgi:hypothetical protein
VEQSAKPGAEERWFMAITAISTSRQWRTKYPLPNMADLAPRLDSCTIFSKLDLQQGYLQVPVATADIGKTAIITPFSLFEFVRMPLACAMLA